MLRIEVEYGKEAIELEALKKEIEALLNARLSFRAARTSGPGRIFAPV